MRDGIVCETSTVQVGGCSFQLQPGNLFNCTIIGEVTAAMVPGLKKAVYGLAESVEGTFDVLVNLNRAGKSSREARNLWQAFSEDPRSRKIALFGINPLARVLANFLIYRSGNKTMRFFNDDARALAWLRE